MNAFSTYRGLLSNRPLTLLLGGEFISAIGDWLYYVAILIVIYEETADPLVLGLFGAARVVPYVFLSIPAGIVADRFDRRLVLLATDVMRGVCMLGMAVIAATDGPVFAIVALAILAACGSTFFYPAIGAYIPNIVRDERELGPANGLWASLDNLGFIIGPALGGLLVATGGAVFAFLINAATFAFIAAILWRLPPSRNVKPAEPAEPDAAGIAVTSAAAEPEPPPVPRTPTRPLIGILLVAFTLYAFDGGVGILTVILAIDILDAGEAATGYLNAAIGLGGILGGVVSGVFILRRGLGAPMIAGALVAAAALAILGFVQLLAGALLGLALYSLGYFVVDVILTTILQRILPDAIRGRGIGLEMAVGTVGEMTGAIALPVIVTTIGIWILGPAALLLVAAAVVGLVLIGPAATRPTTEFEAALATIRGLPLFAGVSGQRLEGAIRHFQTVPVEAGQSIIREGEPADRFYLVKSGAFSVTQRDLDAEARVLRTLGPDSVFGELGLLTGAPRSATVTATSDAVLLALDGADFLDLVGRGGPLRGRLLGLYTQVRPGR